MESNKSHFYAGEEGKIYGINQSYEELVELYGKENADYLVQELSGKENHEPLFYIDLPETFMKENIAKFIRAAKKRKQEYIMLKGDISLHKRLLQGNWNEDFLIIEPGAYVSTSYNQDVIRAET